MIQIPIPRIHPRFTKDAMATDMDVFICYLSQEQTQNSNDGLVSEVVPGTRRSSDGHTNTFHGAYR
jgi:hypothetical protein